MERLPPRCARAAAPPPIVLRASPVRLPRSAESLTGTCLTGHAPAAPRSAQLPGSRGLVPLLRPQLRASCADLWTDGGRARAESARDTRDAHRSGPLACDRAPVGVGAGTRSVG